MPVPVYRKPTGDDVNDLISTGSSGESCSDEDKDNSPPGREEFHLSFPPSLAMGSRALPSAAACLGHSGSYLLSRRPTNVANEMVESDGLDKKIESRNTEIIRVPECISVGYEIGAKKTANFQSAGKNSSATRKFVPSWAPTALENHR